MNKIKIRGIFSVVISHDYDDISRNSADAVTVHSWPPDLNSQHQHCSADYYTYCVIE